MTYLIRELFEVETDRVLPPEKPTGGRRPTPPPQEQCRLDGTDRDFVKEVVGTSLSSLFGFTGLTCGVKGLSWRRREELH